MKQTTENQNVPKPERINMVHIYHTILGVFNFDKGIFFTIKSLFIQPGSVIREFLYEDRTKLVKPMKFLLLTIAIGTFLTLWLLQKTPQSENSNLEFIPSSLIKSDTLKAISQSINESILQYFNLIQLIKVPFIAAASYFLFRKSDFNYAEHLVINAYLFAILTFGFTLFVPLLLYYPYFIGAILFIFTFGYMIWGYYKLFDESFLATFLKTVLVYFISNVFHSLIMIITLLVIYYFNSN